MQVMVLDLLQQGFSELLKAGIDIITGGNHSLIEKNMMVLLETQMF